MDTDGLFASILAINEKKAPLAIIIPCFGERELLEKHLALLSRQTMQEFCALVILGNNFDEKSLAEETEKKKFKFGVVLAKRNEDNGSAGGFYCGQKLALQKGFEYMILADVDCMPDDRNLVQSLMDKKEGGYVSASEKFEREDGTIFEPKENERERYIPIYHYTLFSAQIVKKYGLCFLPAYNGADDAEYAERIKERREFADGHAIHPLIIGDRTFRKMAHFWAYTLNTVMIIRNPKRVLLNFLRSFISAWAMMFFSPPYGAKLGAKIMIFVLGFEYGKKARDLLCEVEFSRYILRRADFFGKEWKVVEYSHANSLFGLVAMILTEMPVNFRKNILMDAAGNDMMAIAMAISAKKLYYNMGDGRYLLMADNENFVLHLLKLAAFAVIAPVATVLALLAFIPIKLIKQPDTFGYGLEKK